MILLVQFKIEIELRIWNLSLIVTDTQLRHDLATRAEASLLYEFCAINVQLQLLARSRNGYDALSVFSLLERVSVDVAFETLADLRNWCFGFSRSFAYH